MQTRCLVEVTLPQPIHAIPHRIERRGVRIGQHSGPIADLCLGTRPARGCVAGGEPTNSPQLRPPVWRTPKRPSSECSSCTSGRNSGYFLSRRFWESTGCQRRTLRPVPSTFGKAGAFSQAVFTWEGHTVGYLDEARFISALRSACK